MKFKASELGKFLSEEFKFLITDFNGVDLTLKKFLYLYLKTISNILLKDLLIKTSIDSIHSD